MFQEMIMIYHSENFGRIDKEYHKRKISLAYDKGIKLLSFFSDEWKHYIISLTPFIHLDLNL
jgi:hypothetical protein